MDPDDLFSLRNQFWLGNYEVSSSQGSLAARAVLERAAVCPWFG